jgi:hypothetical protein
MIDRTKRILALMLFAALATAAEKTHDYTSQATVQLSASSTKWTFQFPADATKSGRVKGLLIQTTGGTGGCDFTVYRGATLASSGTVVTPSKVSDKIEGGTVPAPQARFYSGSNSINGTQLGVPYRLASTDRISIPYDALYLAAGETLMVVSGTCTITADVMTLHEEY